MWELSRRFRSRKSNYIIQFIFKTVTTQWYTFLTGNFNRSINQKAVSLYPSLLSLSSHPLLSFFLPFYLSPSLFLSPFISLCTYLSLFILPSSFSHSFSLPFYLSLSFFHPFYLYLRVSPSLTFSLFYNSEWKLSTLTGFPR